MIGEALATHTPFTLGLAHDFAGIVLEGGYAEPDQASMNSPWGNPAMLAASRQKGQNYFSKNSF